MRVLVTGCAGFVGSHLSEALLDAGHSVVGVDCFTDYYARSVKEENLRQLQSESQFTLRQVDLAEADLSAVIDGMDIIFHQAAQPGVRASWGSTFETYVRNNVLATQRLLESCKGRPLKKFVYASSSSIYGDAESFPTTESALPRPISPYGVTKLSGEQLAYLYWRNYEIPTVSLRYFTAYGPRQRPDMAFHRFIRAALEGKSIQVYGDGEQTRDFTYIADVVAANIAASESPLVGRALNVGGGSRVSVNQVISVLGELIGRPPGVQHVSTVYGDARDTSADISAARREINYAPRVDLRTGLERELRWLEQSVESPRPTTP
jgi:nucleoside-diphosphate-sugar epimerase